MYSSINTRRYDYHHHHHNNITEIWGRGRGMEGAKAPLPPCHTRESELKKKDFYQVQIAVMKPNKNIQYIIVILIIEPLFPRLLCGHHKSKPIATSHNS